MVVKQHLALQIPPLSLQHGGTLTGVLHVYQAVMSVDEERARLEREAEALVTMDDPEVEQRLIDVYERCGRACFMTSPCLPILLCTLLANMLSYLHTANERDLCTFVCLKCTHKISHVDLLAPCCTDVLHEGCGHTLIEEGIATCTRV